MQQEFHYTGLPFTLIVDPRGRVVEEIRGFGSAETWSHLTRTLEAEMTLPASASQTVSGDDAPTGHEGHGAAEGGDGSGNQDGP